VTSKHLSGSRTFWKYLWTHDRGHVSNLAISRLKLFLNSYKECGLFCLRPPECVSWDNSIGTATRYGLDGPGIEYRWGTAPPPVQWLPGLFLGSEAAGAWRLPTSIEVKERLELYLFSPSGSSWPVQLWTLSLLLPPECTCKIQVRIVLYCLVCLLFPSYPLVNTC
jgi:hypothetical protein